MKKLFPFAFALVILTLNLSKIYAQTYPLVSIHDLQYVDDQSLSQTNAMDSSVIYAGDTVQIEGVVTFDPCAYGQSTTGSRVGTFLAQPNDSGAWSGIHVLIDPGTIGYGSGPAAVQQLSDDVLFHDNFVYGNTVKATGILSNFSNNTQLVLLPVQSVVTSISNPVPGPHVLSIDTFEISDGQGGQIFQPLTGEKYEGTYVEFQNVRIVDVSVTSGGARINWSLQDNFGNKIKVRDMSGWVRNDTSDNFCTSSGSYTVMPFDTPIVNSVLAFVRGVIIEYKTTSGPYEYWLAPLTLNDIGPTTYVGPTVISTTLSQPIPNTTQSQTVTALITDDQSVASAVLYYTVGLSGTVFTSTAMTNIGGNNWQATIPATGPDSTYIKYWIKATDNQGYYTNTPDSLGTNSYYLILNSGITSLTQLNINPLGYFNSPYINETITNMNAPATVVSTTSLYDEGRVFIQDAQIPWSGIALKGPGIYNLIRGERINITKGKVIEDFGVTTLDSVTFTILDTLPEITPIMTVPMDSVIAGLYNYTEKYESMLLGYDTVYVVSLNPDAPSNFGEWAVYESVFPVGQLRCDDESNDIGATFNTDSLILNQQLDYIYGILTRAHGNWKLLPRNLDDIAGFHTVFISTNDLITENKWIIYPNPACSELTVSCKQLTGDAEIQLFDASGRMIMNRKSDSKNTLLNIQLLSAGTYFIRINDGSGVMNAKVIKM
ncbi:MAG TPA: hypothetical protein DCQ93_00805 [Bacteroidetes bacterium]|nr:hypothetical protein [Bacteroidota bacterium]